VALVPIKTSARTGYCDCICGCYNLCSLRDEETSKSYCPVCAKDHLALNTGLGIAAVPPAKSAAAPQVPAAPVPDPADPPGRLR
jgi:hypothetical protein